jgi:hypothetical protein
MLRISWRPKVAPDLANALQWAGHGVVQEHAPALENSASMNPAVRATEVVDGTHQIRRLYISRSIYAKPRAA